VGPLSDYCISTSIIPNYFYKGPKNMKQLESDANSIFLSWKKLLKNISRSLSSPKMQSALMVGTSKMAPNLKVPSSKYVHFPNQLCTYLDGALLETNFDP